MSYTVIKDWINAKLHREKEKYPERDPWSWSEKRPKDQQDLDENFVEMNNWPAITIDKWRELVEEMRKYYNMSTAGEPSALKEATEQQLAKITWMDTLDSCWQVYRTTLRDKKWDEDDLNTLCESVFQTSKNLTCKGGPVKGLVVGQVQSGKTANFAGLMALAADNSWNIFIVLSGTIENLRVQTQARLLDDLNKGGANSWHQLQKVLPITAIDNDQSPARLILDNKDRYMKVCLKNVNRLTNLRDWLFHDPNVAQHMRIIIIDDEADQAGINTLANKADEYTKINNLIREIVHGSKLDPDEKLYRKQVTYGAMNYIGYTATPYANILNETGENSLYPRHFIRLLRPSKYYFGPARIFGEPEFNGIDMWREIPDGTRKSDVDLPEYKMAIEEPVNELKHIQEIHRGLTEELPQTLKEAICWYLCCAAVFRYQKKQHPSSMLIHTSQKISSHTNLRKAIQLWLNDCKSEVLSLCRCVWEKETSRLPLDTYYSQCNSIEGHPEYPKNIIEDYPLYDDFAGYITELLKKVSHIELGNDVNEPLKWHNGIHICEDNCHAGEDGDYQLRLMYPPKEKRDFSHAFIVVGGNTLSRGLTLEGLVSSYFLRTTTTTIDTLTQMGRWFGFRRGYELYPRIWMTKDTFLKFKRISLSEKSLREEILRYACEGRRPSEFAPRVLTHPHSRLNPTARNRMHAALPEIDFSGNAIQTTIFYDDKAILESNECIIADLIQKMQNHIIFKPVPDSDNKLWRNIPGQLIRDLLSTYKFGENARDFEYVDVMIEWLEKQETNGNWPGWNVALCCASPNPKQWIPVEGVSIGKTNLQPYKKPDGLYKSYAFKTIRDRKHFLIDVDPGIYKTYMKKHEKSFHDLEMIDYWNIRMEGGLASTPQLILYCIDKDYENTNAPHDFVGFSIFFPGSDYRAEVTSNYLQAKICAAQEEDNSSDIDDSGN
jgi:hypothetical protein